MRRTAPALLLPFLPVAAFAAAAEHHAAPAVPWAELLFSFVNLGIFLYLLPRIAPAILPKLGLPGSSAELRARRQEIVDALEQAAQAKQESERLRADWQEKLANLKLETEAIRKQAQAEIAAERDEILAAARRLAETIRRDAQRAAEQEMRNAESTLRGEVALRAFEVARRLAPERITEAEQHRFVGEFIHQVQP